jgi:hypothetical protein
MQQSENARDVNRSVTESGTLDKQKYIIECDQKVAEKPEQEILFVAIQNSINLQRRPRDRSGFKRVSCSSL